MDPEPEYCASAGAATRRRRHERTVRRRSIGSPPYRFDHVAEDVPVAGGSRRGLLVDCVEREMEPPREDLRRVPLGPDRIDEDPDTSREDVGRGGRPALRRPLEERDV